MSKGVFQISAILTWVLLVMVSFSSCGGAKTDEATDKSVSRPAASEASEAKPTTKEALSPEQRDPNRLWCNEHGLYEDECVICHPEIANKKKTPEERNPNRLWCNEHSVYEDECLICHPELGQKQPADATTNAKPAANAEQARPGAVLMCEEHALPETECGICHPELMAGAAVGEGMKVRFASEDSTTKAGVGTGKPNGSSNDGSDYLLGQVSFNRNALAIVTPLADGVVREVFKDVGDSVLEGDLMATVQSLDVAEAKSEYAKALAEAELARQTLAREQDLFNRKISPRQDLEQAQAAVKVSQSEITESRQHLLNLGLLQEDLKSLGSEGAGDSLLAIRAPFSGTVIERSAVVGSAVSRGDAVFEVADLSTMWMQVSVQELRLSTLQIGARAQARFDAYPGIAFEGEVNWIAPGVDPQTRLVQARVLLQNPQGLLRDGLFGRATFSAVAGDAEVAVPTGAIQDVDGKPVVFKKLSNDLFEACVVALGSTENGHVTVLGGLSADEEIVTTGSYTMKSELLKARLGAGCTHE